MAREESGTRLQIRQVMTLWVLPFASIAMVVVLAIVALVGGAKAPDSSGETAHAHAHHGRANNGVVSHQDFFTNNGQYMERTGCLATADGTPDWPWIITLIVLNAGIIIAYLRIYIFWFRSYFAEAPKDRNSKLMDLAQVFLWCAICGYAAGILMFFWPAYRLTALCLLILNIWSWRFAFNLRSFQINFSARRYQRLASCDTLTGLPNRMAVRALIEQKLKVLHSSQGAPFAVLFLDFDRFKLVNDTLGHAVGDELLKSIAKRLDTLFSADGGKLAIGTAARLGGDEFVIVLEEVDEASVALDIAMRLVQAFDVDFVLQGRQVRSMPSIGVAMGAKAHADADQVLRDADVAMYAAKADERHPAMLFDQSMLASVVERMELEHDLRKAIDAQQFELFYQPLINLESGKVEGFEALIRWHHPTRGMVSPDAFIPVAEETGQINDIGAWVFEEALRQLATWDRAGLGRNLQMHVNLSTVQLYDTKLAAGFQACAKAAGIAPHRLTLEVTESALVEDMEGTSAVLHQLREAGFAIAMDDFGTGYSSLSLLHKFPITQLKIDRSFINNLTDRSDYAAVIHAIVTLASNLSIAVVAEGIETATQLAELQALDCDLAQGYFFSKPMQAQHAEHWMSSWLHRRKSA